MPEAAGRPAPLPVTPATVGLAAAVPAVSTALWRVGQKVGQEHAEDVLKLSRIPRNGVLGAVIVAEAALLSRYLHEPDSAGAGAIQGLAVGGAVGGSVPLLKALVSDGYVQHLSDGGSAASVTFARKFVGSSLMWGTGAAIGAAVAGAAYAGLKGRDS